MTTPPSLDELITALKDDPVKNALTDSLGCSDEELDEALETLQTSLEGVETEPSTSLTLQVDGAARNNPGPGGGGAILIDENGSVVRKKSEFLGKSVTNNEAEYRALLLGLDLVPPDTTALHLQMDSELAIKQLKGDYQVKSENLRPYYERVKKRLDDIETIRLEHIPREENERADQLANEAIDKFERRKSLG